MFTQAQLVAMAGAVAVLLSGVTGLLVYLLSRKKAPLEVRKLEVDIVTGEADLIRGLLADVQQMREELDALRVREAECQKRLEENNAEFYKFSNRLMWVETLLPMTLVSAKLRNSFDTTRTVFDACRDGIVITAPSDGGRFIYCNPAFAAALGMEPGDVIATQWQQLVHPEDVDETTRAEGDAWTAGGTIENRYRHADGHYVPLRWHFTNYDDGASLSIVYFERRRTDAGA